MNVNLYQIISYVVIVTMLSTSAIYFVTTYEQFTDESGDGFHEMAGEKETGQETGDLDKSQWYELDLGGKMQTIFFLFVGIVYVLVGMCMLANRHGTKLYLTALVGSVSLVVFYAISRTVDLPVVGMQSDIGVIDITVKILQSGIVAGCLYLVVIKRKMETNPTSS